MRTPYGPLSAEFYQITKPINADYQDLAYYGEILSVHKGKVLEIGSGTGRFLLPLMAEGLKIEGLENNPHMNAWCLKNARALKIASPTLIKDDLRTWKVLPRHYEAIVFSFGSLQLFPKWNELEIILKKLHKTLKANGKLYIDIDITRMDVSRSGVKVQGARVECEDGSEILLEGSKSYDFVNQIESHLMRYEKWRVGKLIATELQELEVRWIGVHELRLLLKDVGFKNVDFCYDYQPGYKESDGSSEVVCFVASK